jgi:hypothetical protein
MESAVFCLVTLCKVHPLYGQGYVIVYAGALAEEKSYMELSFTPVYEYQKFDKNRIQ